MIAVFKANSITTTMFSFLKSGDFYNTIRSLTNLPGLFTSDGDKIKYALLNHSVAMRKNLGDGAPIFQGIRQLETELEREDNIASIASGRLHSMAAAAANAAAAVTDAATRPSSDVTRIDNAALAFIMAKELAFLNRTLQMITLIANRYNEEQEDNNWGRGDSDSDSNGDSDSDSDSDIECGDYNNTPPLQRSQSYTTNENCGAQTSSSSSHVPNQLATTFLIASGRMHQQFNHLCELTGTNPVIVNAMTTMDRPHNMVNKEKQLSAQYLVVSDIFHHFVKFDEEHREPVVSAFLELRDISVAAWRIMSMFAFSNLFRLTEGTEFSVLQQPDDAIFTQGRDYTLQQSTI